jgi:hypothetical protein
VQAAGNIWANAQLYQDSLCTESFATIMDIDGQRVLLRFNTGEMEWVERESFKWRTFVHNALAHDVLR